MTDPGRVVATLLLASVVLTSVLLPGLAADGASLPPPPAAPPFSTTSGVCLVRVYPIAPRDDEFVEIENGGVAGADLSGWSLTDREETATFPPGTHLPPGARLVATKNSTAYAEDVRSPADLTYDRGDAPRMGGGALRLADTGDEVLLRDDAGDIVDAYVYGVSSYLGPGWSGPPAEVPGRGEIATRVGTVAGRQDTDSGADWSGLRAYRLGQSMFDPPPVEIATRPEVLVSPDDGREGLRSFLASADRTLEVAVYTLTSESITSVLAERALAGVRVRVLLEESPVGGVDDAEAEAITHLLSAGAEVRLLASAGDAVKRYRYLHAKYAIVDGESVVVASENFGDSGFPPSGEPGNRGWSVVVHSLPLAGQLWEVFEEDFDPSRVDSVPAAGGRGGEPPAYVAPRPVPPPVPCEPWHAQLVIGPDTSLSHAGILGAFAAAKDHLWIEAFYADDPWAGQANPFLEAAFAAARLGVSVRILLDGGRWSAEEDVGGNEALASALNERAHREGVDLEARLLAPSGNVERLHNKGVVIDGKKALVSSMNWAFASATLNREIGLLLDEPAAVERLEAAFVRDWTGDLGDSLDEPMIDDPAIVVGLYAFVAAASALSLRKMRRRDKGLKPRAGMIRRGVLRTHLRRGHREVRVLSPELVAEPRDGPGGGAGDRRGGEGTHEGVRGSAGDRDP